MSDYNYTSSQCSNEDWEEKDEFTKLQQEKQDLEERLAEEINIVLEQNKIIQEIQKSKQRYIAKLNSACAALDDANSKLNEMAQKNQKLKSQIKKLSEPSEKTMRYRSQTQVKQRPNLESFSVLSTNYASRYSEYTFSKQENSESVESIANLYQEIQNELSHTQNLHNEALYKLIQAKKDSPEKVNRLKNIVKRWQIEKNKLENKKQDLENQLLKLADLL